MSTTAPASLGTELAQLNRAAEAVWPDLHAQWQAHLQGQNPILAQPLHPLAQAGAVALPEAGFSVEVLASIDSTNTELMRRARAGQAEPVLLVAASQTAGRGRMGKTWLSQPGDSLTFSMALPLRPAHWAGLSLAVGVSLAESLASLLPAAQRPALQLKWPNDLWLHRAKLAGILVETAHTAQGPCVVVGVGINVVAPAADWLAQLATSSPTPAAPPTGLRAHGQPGGEPPTAASVLETVAPALLQTLLAFESLGFSAFAQRFASRDALHGQALVLSDGAQGTGCGVDDTGALLVLTDSGMRSISSNEVSVRPGPNTPAPGQAGRTPC